MKVTTAHTKEVWNSGDFAGDDRRPTTRITIQKMSAPRPQYRLDDERSQDWAHSGGWLCLLFGQAEQRPRELFNVKSVKWERGVDTDVGSCTIVLGNVQARNADDPASDSELDFPGWYTPNRGAEDYFDEWGYVTNGWKNWLIPDRLIRTYEGYGVDPDVAPELDTHLYPSGTWLIDDVIIETNGLITLQCRDIGRVLLDQVLAFGLVPNDVYPLWFDAFSDRATTAKAVTPASGHSWATPRYDRDSNRYYASHPEIRDNGRPVVMADNTVDSHHPRDAFDASTFQYWVSPGFHSKKDRDAYSYIQGKMDIPRSVEGVKVDAQHGPYTMYVSLQNADGDWVGNKRIPYKAGAVDSAIDTNANVPYVAAFEIKKGETASFKLPRRFTDIKKIRYTFTSTWVGYGIKRACHTCINSVYWCSDVTTASIPGTFTYGNYGDYTEIIKWLTGWAGWFWPPAESGLNVQTYSDGTEYNLTPASDDPALPEGRIWGDFESTGTNGLTKFGADAWDKKPIIDGIALIRDITGFDFWIDETGGVVWRLPNIWSKGCYVMPTKGGPRTTRTGTLVEVDERKHLVNQAVKLSSRNNRERIYIANFAGNVGAVVHGYNPGNTGLKRYGGWTDQHFRTAGECERMADLIALKQSFTYRQNQLTIAANPSIQPDDQIVIVERMTGEGFIHRVLSIASDFDNETGRWTYSLTTNWLGTKAFTKLAWDPNLMTNATKVYLGYMGHI